MTVPAHEMPVEDLWPVSRTACQTQALHCLLRQGVGTAGQLAEWKAGDLLDLRTFGVGALAEVRRALGEHGLSLAGEEVTA